MGGVCDVFMLGFIVLYVLVVITGASEGIGRSYAMEVSMCADDNVYCY